MRNDARITIHRSDYREPPFLVDHVELSFDLDPVRTRVISRLSCRRNASAEKSEPLALDGDALELISIRLDEKPLAANRFRIEPQRLVIEGVPDQCTLTIENVIAPQANTELMGLFVSNGSFFTQCEAEGFRRITFFPDRPDVMATYAVTLNADRKRYPVLLGNGNLVEQGELSGGRHFARWQDPFPKPSYLFALVAGRFEAIESRLTTRSGRDVLLQVYVAPGESERARYALESLERAIRWDEQRFGLELDLDRFMIVASHDFNLGAMENKGLNIFNAKYVLADARIATDADYQSIESIVGHEYFHNWTGNRVTCRDWFQLSLKEGLTVFRDQEFSADMATDPASRAVRRIEDVRRLRAEQFTEDAGPMAHPVRPDSYQEIGNFYTPTVYEKGAEVVRMLHTLLGEDGFQRGMALYFERHDGQAVTCDDFVAAMSDANGRDLKQFSRWYAQAGTPRVSATGRYDAEARRYELALSQSTPATPGQPAKLPMVIPLAVGLIDESGHELPLRLEGEPVAGAVRSSRVLELSDNAQTFAFVDVPRRPVASIARGFSAPVHLDLRYDDDELALLAAYDTDPFNRWEALQRVALARLLQGTDAIEFEQQPQDDDVLAELFERVMLDDSLAPAFKYQALTLPSESTIAEHRAVVDAQAIRQARLGLTQTLARKLQPHWQRLYAELASTVPYTPDPASAGRRALRNLALHYLVEFGDAAALELARTQLDHSDNMTDRRAALVAIVNSGAPFKADVLVHLAREWDDEPLLMHKWFQVQATAIVRPREVPVLERVRTLLRHKRYKASNPNNVYALVLAFFASNPAEFHRADGAGYAFWAEQVLQLDQHNPTVAAKVARTLERWRRYAPDRQIRMRHALEEVARAPSLSRDVHEIVSKALE